MANPAAQLGWAVTSSRLNKRILQDEKNTWRNRYGTPAEFFEDIKAGQATAPVLGLNITDRQEDQAQAGLEMPDPTLGPFRRGSLKDSERNNGNIAEIWIEGFDLDGDASLETIDASPTLQQLMMGYYTTSSHLIGNKGERVRLVFVLEHPIVLDYETEEYSDYRWRHLAVRAELLRLFAPELGIENLNDPSGNDPARIWYGNTGPSSPIGSEDYPDTPAGEAIQKVYGNTLPWSFVLDAWKKWEDHYRLTPEQISKRAAYQSQQSEGGVQQTTPRQLKVASYILSNRVLSDRRATDRDTWFKVACACKRLDPHCEVLGSAFLLFSQQTPYDNCIGADELHHLWEEVLPQDPKAGITSLKEAADEDSPGWQNYCPAMGNGLQAQAIYNYNGTGIMPQMIKMLEDLDAGKYQSSQQYTPSRNGFNGYEQPVQKNDGGLNDDF